MKTYTNEERKNHVAAWKAGDLSRNAYARGHGIPVANFCKRAQEDGPRGREFVELPHAAFRPGNREIIIDKGDIRIRFPVETLERVLQAVFAISGGTV